MGCPRDDYHRRHAQGVHLSVNFRTSVKLFITHNLWVNKKAESDRCCSRV